jgi:putative transposase
VFGAQAVVQRCIWHKRENVVSYLPKAQQDVWRAKLQRAWKLPTYELRGRSSGGYTRS